MPAPRPLRVFYAAGLAPVMESLRDDLKKETGIELLAEASGSQVACRKLTELGRPCDLVILADASLVRTLLPGTCAWRLDFALDEMVLGVGARAPGVPDAERDWPSILSHTNARLARVDENQSPTGYRTLMVLRLSEKAGGPPVYDRFLSACDTAVDDVQKLVPLLKNGERDYAFLYKSTCIANDIRYIELDKRINLGSPGVDYSQVSVSFDKLKAGEKETVTLTAAPATWSLTAPASSTSTEAAALFIRELLTRHKDLLIRNGFRPLDPPLFFGPAPDHARFAPLAEVKGMAP